MPKLRQELVGHVGGKPSVVERALIERAVQLSLQIELMQEKFDRQTKHTDHDHYHYLSWSNALARTLGKLGLIRARPCIAPAVLSRGDSGSRRCSNFR